MMLVGNKKDLEEQRSVTYAEGEQFAEENGMMFLESSAKTKVNHQKIFTDLAVEILAKVTNGDIDLLNEVNFVISSINLEEFRCEIFEKLPKHHPNKTFQKKFQTRKKGLQMLKLCAIS